MYWLIKRLIKVVARVSYHARRWCISPQLFPWRAIIVRGSLLGLEPRRQGVQESCGACAPQAAQGLTLRHDQGSQFMSHDCQSEIAFLGIVSSLAFVRAPAGNGMAPSVW